MLLPGHRKAGGLSEGTVRQCAFSHCKAALSCSSASLAACFAFYSLAAFALARPAALPSFWVAYVVQGSTSLHQERCYVSNLTGGLLFVELSQLWGQPVAHPGSQLRLGGVDVHSQLFGLAAVCAMVGFAV